MPAKLPAFTAIAAIVCTALAPLSRSLGQAADPRVVIAPPIRDGNLNRIDDALEVKAATGVLIGPAPDQPRFLLPGLLVRPEETGRKPYADLLVSLDHPPGAADFQQVAALGGQVIRSWRNLVFCMNVHLPEAVVGAGGIQAVSALPAVTWVEENHPAQLHLEYSTRQTRARAAWTRTTAVDGRSDIRIAVCDTGLDGTAIGSTHTDLSGKIAAWYDAYAVIHSQTPYANAIDENGHGTHVAGIVAGTGASAGIATGDGLLRRTHSAFFSATAGGVWNVPTIRMPIDTTGTGATSSISSSTYWTTSPSPGSFVLSELWDSRFATNPLNPGLGSLNWGYKASSDTQPLDVAYDYVSSDIQDFKYVGSPYPYESDHATAWYVSQNACRQVAVGDDYNLNAGVAPDCGVVGVRVVDKWGLGNTGASELLEGLDWISSNKETYGIVAANMSLGYGSGPGGALDTAVNTLVGQGVVCVASAGNQRGTASIGEPGTAAKAITVAATSEVDQITSYSSLGGTDSGKPDVAAPGGSTVTKKDITSLDTGDGEYIKDYAGSADAIDLTERFPDDYAGKTGTSVAAPHVAGLVGLLVDAMGGISAWNWSESQALLTKSIILMTATETNQNAEAGTNPTLDRGAKDLCEGYGRINADAAVSAVADELALDTDGSASTSTSFDSAATGRKCWARYVRLKRSAGYVFSMSVPAGCDADLYLYDDTPDANGNPDIIASRTTDTRGSGVPTIETFYRYVVDPGDSTLDTYYLVAKLVDGSGVMDISSITITPAEVSGLKLVAGAGRAELRWEVAEPESLVGFNVYAADGPRGDWHRCNDSLIPSNADIVTWAIPKRFLSGGPQRFRLESVDLYGNKTDHGFVELRRP